MSKQPPSQPGVKKESLDDGDIIVEHGKTAQVEKIAAVGST